MCKLLVSCVCVACEIQHIKLEYKIEVIVVLNTICLVERDLNNLVERDLKNLPDSSTD